MDAIIQVREQGAITLPSELCKKYNIESGRIFKLVDLDGIFALVPMIPMIPELAREIERCRLKEGLGMEELLQNLRVQREQYNNENYGG
jgi:bifunctional DNA-binding transcriptional regulator/antitoxin component of YhaV-PrlF toxin-antitoxin module